MSLQKLIFHPFFFSIIPILFLFQNNIHELPFENIVESLFYSVIIATVIFIPLKFLVGWSKSGIITSLSFATFKFFIFIFTNCTNR